MKRQKYVFVAGGLLLVLFMAVSGLIFHQSRQEIEAGYLASEGSAAENFAVLTAENIHLSDAQVQALKDMSYPALQASAENTALAEMMGNESFSTKVDYAYVMVHLNKDEVQYEVTPENSERFGAPLGTKLDIMWLLDVNVSEDAANNKMSTEESELSRYSYYIEEDAQIFGTTPTYIYNSSEWGDHICGYAPLYSIEGTYIGAVGVELQVKDYSAYCGRAVTAMGTLVTVTLLLLTLVFLYIYHHYRARQFEKIYTDALTGISNRSYYNDRFVRRMNACRHGKKIFALMITDIDLFKKVNDTFGHEVGDAVLIEMGEILLKTFDKSQVVRFGGEEFVAGIWVDSEAQLNEKIEALYSLVHEHKFSNQELKVGISLGCSWYRPEVVDGWLLSGMLRAADCSLYFCKEHGRDQARVVQYDPKKEYKKE